MLKFYKEEIDNLMREINYSKVSMEGYYINLKRIKDRIEIMFDRDIYPIGHALDDAPFFGWEGERLNNMRLLYDEIDKKVKELYALILCGLGGDIN